MPEIPKQILRFPKVEEMVGMKKSTIYKRIREGTFPEPVQLGPKSTGFYRHEIEDWVATLERGLVRHVVARAVAGRQAKRRLKLRSTKRGRSLDNP